jgi:hypothetical protein
VNVVKESIPISVVFTCNVERELELAEVMYCCTALDVLEELHWEVVKALPALPVTEVPSTVKSPSQSL